MQRSDISAAIAAIVAAAPHSIIGRCRVPANVLGSTRRGKGKVWRWLRKQEEHAVGGKPSRPWQRALKRAYAEDAARKTRPPQRELVEADIASSKRTLPKATKLDRGSLAGGIGRHTQRI